jgi:hypothetical protein
LKAGFLKESIEPGDNFNLVDDEDDMNITEMSSSGNAGGYETPYAFGKASKDTIEQLGYKTVEKPERKKIKEVKPSVEESTFKRMSREMFLQEISYSDYKKDLATTPKQKVNACISEINKSLREVEKVVNRNIRLKQEIGIDNSIYWKSSKEGIMKINERLVRLAQKLKELSS